MQSLFVFEGEVQIMMNYERPMLVKTEQMSEGVYLASGASGCWTFTYYKTSNNVPSEGEGQEFQINGSHSNPEHHVAYPVITLTFNQPITGATSTSGYPTSCSGNAVTIGCNIGTTNATENLGFAIRVTSSTAADLQITGLTYTCPN